MFLWEGWRKTYAARETASIFTTAHSRLPSGSRSANVSESTMKQTTLLKLQVVGMLLAGAAYAAVCAVTAWLLVTGIYEKVVSWIST